MVVQYPCLLNVDVYGDGSLRKTPLLGKNTPKRVRVIYRYFNGIIEPSDGKQSEVLPNLYRTELPLSRVGFFWVLTSMTLLPSTWNKHGSIKQRMYLFSKTH